MSPSADRPKNHLEGQTSPYLLQHVHNPVDWYPWGDEALERARREDKPIFLSIGYAACHWCHVMERESFENEEIAAFLNAHFVPVKVDREERPDLDEIYMNAVQLLTGSGGWPLNVFLTPDLEPFVGGTYFPPRDMHGRPGFLTVLGKIAEAWTSRRDKVDSAGKQLAESLRAIAAGAPGGPGTDPVGRSELARAVAELTRRFDGRWGGFSPAPKFPPHGALNLLLRDHRRGGQRVPLDMARFTLERMALGGMYDQIGGGFARYSVDERWLTPHFEKMLYDQALLVPVYVDAWLLTGEPLYRRVVEETLDFVRRELTDPGGGLYSSLDADSEGVEGKFYVWTPDEVVEALGREHGERFCRIYGIRAPGNFEGRSIPNLLGGSLAERARAEGLTEQDLVGTLEPLRATLLQVRSRRVRPGTDDKVLTAWNGLVITALCRAHQALGRPEDLDSAERAARFVLDELRGPDGRLRVSWRAGRSQLNAYLDDHAFLARALVDLYETTFDRAWLDAAADVAGRLVRHFEDRENGGFFFTSDDHEELLARSRSQHDGALPAGAGIAVEALLRLSIHLDSAELRGPALRTLRALKPAVAQAPSAFASLLAASELVSAPALEIAIVGPRGDDGVEALLGAVRRRYLPDRAVAVGASSEAAPDLALLAGKTPVGGRPAAYVCREYACDAPVTDPEALGKALDAGAGSAA